MAAGPAPPAVFCPACPSWANRSTPAAITSLSTAAASTTSVPSVAGNTVAPWHLNFLGPKLDRRPDKCGVMFQLEPGEGRWYLGIYELTPCCRHRPRRYLADIILKSKKIAHLPMGSPAMRIYPHGADIPIDYAASERYDYVPAVGNPPMKLGNSAYVFSGKCRGVLTPKP